MFYQNGVDISSVKSMWEFLQEHPTYSTLNSWNGLRSIAHNVKLYNLELEGDWTVVLDFLSDTADSGDLQFLLAESLEEFARENPGYKVGFNGRSDGYLVLYNQDNWRSVLPEAVTDFETYEEFKNYCKENGERVTDYLRELRDTVTVVRAFDTLCDELRDLANEYSKKNFDSLKLENAVDRFHYEYDDDLDALSLAGPVIEDDHVNLNDIAEFTSFMNLFYKCLGQDARRAYVNDTLLYLKEA